MAWNFSGKGVGRLNCSERRGRQGRIDQADRAAGDFVIHALEQPAGAIGLRYAVKDRGFTERETSAGTESGMW
jgi:hypothetical protein